MEQEKQMETKNPQIHRMLSNLEVLAKTKKKPLEQDNKESNDRQH